MSTASAAIANLRHHDPAARLSAAGFLGDHPAREAEAALIGALADTLWQVRAAAAYALAQIEPLSEGAVRALAGLTRVDADVNVRRTCCYALGYTGASVARSVALAAAFADDPDIRVRCAAAMALEKAGLGAGVEFLAHVLCDPDIQHRFEAFNNLGMLGLLGENWAAEESTRVLSSPSGCCDLAESVKSSYKPRSREVVSTEEFLARAKGAGLSDVGLSLAYEVDDRGLVRRLDFVLMAPVRMPTNAAAGTVHHGDADFDGGAMRYVLGRDDDGSPWLDDGPRLPADDDYIATVRRAGLPGAARTSARARVGALLQLVERIHQSGIRHQILGSGLSPILDWIAKIPDPE